jgi:hypothetical protein
MHTALFNDPDQFLNHYYHFVAELLVGAWAFWSGTLHSANMFNGALSKTPTGTLAHQSGGRLEDQVEEHDNDNKDHTAKMTLQQSHRHSAENVLALQRVRSLTQRDRLVSDSSDVLLSFAQCPTINVPPVHSGSGQTFLNLASGYCLSYQ